MSLVLGQVEGKNSRSVDEEVQISGKYTLKISRYVDIYVDGVRRRS